MKTGKRFIFVFLVCFLCSIFMLTGCNKKADDKEKTTKTEQETEIVVSISITTQPNKVDYLEGEYFDPTGMVVVARYNDSSNKTLSENDYSYDKKALVLNQENVIITYMNKRAIVKINVTKNNGDDKRSDVLIDDTKDYLIEAENLIGEYEIEASDATWTSGGQSIKYLKNAEEVRVIFESSNDYIINIIARMAYYNNYNWAGLQIKFDDTIIKPDTVVSQDPNANGDHLKTWLNWTDVDFGYFDITKGRHTLSITVLGNDGPGIDCFKIKRYNQDEKILKSITVETLPEKLEYNVGEKFDSKGMVVKANYTSGEEVITDYQISNTNELTLADNKIIITYLEKEAEVAITVIDPSIDLTISEAKEYTLDASTLACNPKTEDNNLGGLCVGYTANGQKIIVKFDSNKKYKITIKASMAYHFGYDLDTQMITRMDNEEFTCSASFEGSDGWKDWHTVEIGTFTLDEGTHELVLETYHENGGPAIDYFTFIVEEC